MAKASHDKRKPIRPTSDDPTFTDAVDLPCVGQHDGIVVFTRVTPRGGKDSIDGMTELGDGQRVLKVRVRVAPEEGAANRAVEKIIARALNVPVSRVHIASGATSRLKHIKIEGEPRGLMQALRALLHGA